MKKTVLIVDFEKNWIDKITKNLESKNIHVINTKDTNKIVELAQNTSIGLIIFNFNLQNPIEICKQLRANNTIFPIMFVAQNAETNQIVQALNAGGDDFVFKNTPIAEVVARIVAHLHRFNAAQTLTETSKTKTNDELVLNLRQGYLTLNGKKIPLLAQEIKLLDFMYLHQGELIDRDRLLTEVWGYDKLNLSTRTIDVHIARLRQKMGDTEVPKYLQTVRGVGYKFIAP